MRTEQQVFLSLPSLPARICAEQAAWYLGFQPHDIPILVAAGLLKPLGNPAPNAQKYFSTQVLTELRENRDWLHKATRAIYQYWVDKNGRRKQPGSGG